MQTMILITFFYPLLAILLLILNKNRHFSLTLQYSLACLYLFLHGYNYFYHQTNTVISIGNWPSFVAINLAVSPIYLLSGMVFSIAFIVITLFCHHDLNHHQVKKESLIVSWLLVFSALASIATNDLFNLYVWTELALASAFALVILQQQLKLENIFAYAVLNILGTLCILLSIIFVYGHFGSLNYVTINKEWLSSDKLAPILLLFLVASFAVKAAAFPVYFWIGRAYTNAENFTLLNLAAFSSKATLIVMLRWTLAWPLLLHSITSTLFIIIACLTMLFGVFAATARYNIREILSFHIISQIGYILLAIFAGGSLAITATLYFIIHNIVVKNNLIMVSSSIKYLYNDEKLENLGLIAKHHRFLMVIFLFSALSLAGFPPLSGFWGKFYVLYSAISQHSYTAAFFALLVSLMTLFSMLKIWRYAFCEKAKNKTHSAKGKKDIPLTSKTAMLILLLLSIAMAIFPNFITATG